MAGIIQRKTNENDNCTLIYQLLWVYAIRMFYYDQFMNKAHEEGVKIFAIILITTQWKITDEKHWI